MFLTVQQPKPSSSVSNSTTAKTFLGSGKVTPSCGRLNSNQPTPAPPPLYTLTDQRILLPTKYDWLVDGPFWTITAILLYQIVGEYIDVYSTPCVMYCGWSLQLFATKLSSSPIFRNWLNLPLFTILLIPFCITLLLKIFSLGFISLVLSKLQTDWVGKLLELAATVRKWIEIDIPGIVCSKSRQTMGRRGGGESGSRGVGESGRRDRKRFCVERRWTSRFFTLKEALKTNEKENYMTQKIEIRDVGIPEVLTSLSPFMGDVINAWPLRTFPYAKDPATVARLS